MSLLVDNLGKDYPTRGEPLAVLRGVNLQLQRGDALAVMGPSGSGKSTLLHILGTLDTPTRGRVSLDGVDPFTLSEWRLADFRNRRIGFVFQDHHLLPQCTVLENVLIPTLVSGNGDTKIETYARQLLERVGLSQRLDHRPAELSGGERQRVALARALARDPDVLLLDEPMAALDPHTRGTVRAELHDLLRELALPALLVTHDFEDAAALADRVGVLGEGRLRQLGSADDLLGSPADLFVARLAGANVLSGVAAPAPNGLTAVLLDDGPTVYAADAGSGRTEVVVYPWDVSLARAAPDDSALNHIREEIVSLTPLGNRARVRLRTLTAEITTTSAERLQLRPGETVVASFKATQVRLLPGG